MAYIILAGIGSDTCFCTGGSLCDLRVILVSDGSRVGVLIGITAQAAGVGGVALGFTSSRGNNTLILMRQLRNLPISCIATNGAMLISIPTNLIAGSSLALHLDEAMGEHRNFLLCDGSFTTDGALLSLGQARGCTGRCYCRNCYFRMTGCRNLFRVTVDATAAGIGLHTDLRTGSSGGYLAYMIMPQSSDFLLALSMLTVIALLMIVVASICTGRCFANNVHHLVALCRNFPIAGVVTLATSLIRFPANFCTGRCLGLVIHIVVARSCNCFRLSCITNRTGIGLYSLRSTCGCSCNFSCIPAMTQCGHFCLCNSNYTTNRTLLAFGQTGCGASRCNGRNHYLRMTQCCNNCLGNRNLTANRALLSLGQARGCTGRCYCRNCYFRMTGCRNLFRVTVDATAAGIGLHTDLRTGSSGGYLAYMIMPQSSDFLLALSMLTVIALLMIVVASICTGRCFANNVHHLVALCRNFPIAGVVTLATSLIRFPANFCTGRCLGLVIHIVVAGGRNFVTGISIAATGTGMGGVALFGTGRCCHNCLVIVTGGGCQDLAANSTGLICCAGSIGTGSMAGSIHIGIYIAVFTDTTDMGSIALFGTGRCRHSRCVAVTGGIHIGTRIAVIADTAGISSIALFRTGGQGHRGRITMTLGRCQFLTTNGTGLVCRTGRIRAGGMAGGSNALSVAVTAGSILTSKGLDTFGLTAGLLCNCLGTDVAARSLFPHTLCVVVGICTGENICTYSATVRIF